MSISPQSCNSGDLDQNQDNRRNSIITNTNQNGESYDETSRIIPPSSGQVSLIQLLNRSVLHESRSRQLRDSVGYLQYLQRRRIMDQVNHRHHPGYVEALQRLHGDYTSSNLQFLRQRRMNHHEIHDGQHTQGFLEALQRIRADIISLVENHDALDESAATNENNENDSGNSESRQ